MRLGWLDAVRARNYHRDLYSIYKAWTENEMTIEALLKDILDTNKKIAAYLEHPAAPKDDGSDPFHNRRDLGPPVGYRDPAFENVSIVSEAIKERMNHFDLDGKDVIVARIVFAVLGPYYRPIPRPAAQTIAQLQVAISEIMRGQVKAVPAPRQITRDQVERCILRATDSRRDIIPTYAFADAVDNIMELVNGSAR